MKIDWSKTTVRLDIKAIGRSRWPHGINSIPGWEGKLLKDHDLWYIFAGHGWIVTRAGRFRLSPGSLLWMRPGWEYHITQEPDEPLGMNFIHFDLINHDDSVRPYDEPCPPEHLFPLDIQFVEAITNRIVELCPAHGVPHPVTIPLAGEIATQLFTVLLKHLDAEEELPATDGSGSTQQRHREIVLSSIAILRDNPDAPPKIQELAQQSGYSREHFSRIFKAVTGRSIENYIIEIRIAKASTLLGDVNKTIKEIAYELAYRNEYFFSRQFKRKTGVTPTDFRNSHRIKADTGTAGA
jgi:AraC-like DNA-binding protein